MALDGKPWKAPPFGFPIWVELPAANFQIGKNKTKKSRREDLRFIESEAQAIAARFPKEVFNFPFSGEGLPARYDKDKVESCTSSEILASRAESSSSQPTSTRDR